MPSKPSLRPAFRLIQPDVQCREYGFIDPSGTFVIPPTYEWAKPFSEGLATVMLGRLVGYIDETARMVIPPQFEFVGDFHDGRAMVCKDDAYALIDSVGALVVPFGKYYAISESHDGLAAVRTHFGKRGFIDLDGNMVIEPRFDHVGLFYHERAPVLLNNKWGYINPVGAFVVEPAYEEAGVFCEGLAVVRTSRQGPFHIMNTDGHLVVNDLRFDELSEFSEGKAIFKREGAFGCIDKTGKILFGPSKEWSTIFRFCKGRACFGRPSLSLTSTSTIEENQLFGFLDELGREVIPAQYSLGGNFIDEWCLVEVTGYQDACYINRDGQIMWSSRTAMYPPKDHDKPPALR